MPFVPHTPADEERMLETIGVSSIEDLFDEIPPALRAGELNETPAGVSEMTLMREMRARARQNELELSFLGAGAYEHHIPAAVWDLTTRGEFMTAYTPYQAEASQGTLQLIYEFQTMMSRLMAMDVANASVYDGATAMAEAILMAIRANKKNKSRRVIIAGNLHPHYIDTCISIVSNQGIELVTAAFDSVTGEISTESLDACGECAAVVVSYPSFFGTLGDVHALTDWAHANGAMMVGVVNPTAMALVTPPGQWGEKGADIAVGEGQPLGIPLASGGPYLGFMCCRKDIVRQMPGRIIGRTVDTDGVEGFALTLQAREQHIRRGKATSNICTNQGLLVTAATIYMSLLGDAGLRSVAINSAGGLGELVDSAAAIDGVSKRFSSPGFHEAVLELPIPAADVVSLLLTEGILAGYDLGERFPDLANCLLVNVTESKTSEDIARFVSALSNVLQLQVEGGAAAC